MIKIHEVGLRDGLQNEALSVDTDTKIDWANTLLESGVEILQLGSFVHPEKVPQMADTDLLFKSTKIKKKENQILSGLILNEKGLERALECGVELVCMGVSASDTHSQKNTRMTTSDATSRIIAIAKKARFAGKKVQVSVQSAFGCGFEGKIDYKNVLKIIRKYLENDLYNISLADTAGHAHPYQVKFLIEKIMMMDDSIELTAHFHNTYGLALANCYAAIDSGVGNFETAFGGLGGCPFTKVAAGNVATEDFVHSLNRIGMKKEIDINPILQVSAQAAEYFGKKLEGYVDKAGKIDYETEIL